MGSLPSHVERNYDVLIIGAGLSGLCTLHNIRKRFPSWRVRVLDSAADVGGTWFWNRYPGCRFDSESLSYGFSFDKELLEEWHWKEAFSPQAETHKYIRRVAEKHDLYKDIQFNTTIKSAQWNDAKRTWTFTDDTGREYITTFFISCVGFLSAPTLPAIAGIEAFQGDSFHTSRWPDLDVSRDFAGKRIGVIGTGATGIQTITALSKEPSIKSLSVFQRTANWSAPLRNSEISVEQMAKHRKEYGAIFQQCAESYSGFLHQADPRKSSDVTDEERLALWEKLYDEPGFGKWLGVFSDTYTDRHANELYSEFMASKIRARVHDPSVAESLIPKNHGFGTRRVPLESGYFEAFNQENVHLVDLQKTPISRITKNGIATSDGKEHELDVLIYATGFDAITGAFGAIEWHGKDGRPLISNSGTEKGEKGIRVDHRPRTFLGMTVPAMPNMFMVLGPHQPFGNATRSIEHAAQFISDLLQYCKDNRYTYVRPTEEAVDGWTEHVYECSKGALGNEVDSWMTGVNKNVKGKTVRSVARYSGNAVEFRRRCEDCRLSGYQGLIFG
ncbi:2-oxo-Delta(3)-4,5,5-trimethylcyclopentenylacetyl-CoA monooxygenase [Tolypocladium ophioglossoides CBS 100239]|uniref:2-oxo-Delta(3)-4,5, 5-trimethylcyclopentenylacetyl-CoA monooxygenase n=1 Tax=Tolypocladium ophioglossoides (strain CBS 100239) TaxID=1163406 RepID=A0A0L0NAG4_TOLOC|nr:2-oxo-Delta(3)-4,5,5-trimethylcyclopentenylacetyl-CoA monooxygenase [Tolypocladium ophioglossoides CBS 100239]